MRRNIVAISLLLLSATAFTQVATDSASNKKWHCGGIMSLNASQVSLTNWAAGGENSVGGNAFVNLFANFKKRKTTWDNTLDLGYGKLMQGKARDRIIFKTDDKIDFASKYGRYASKYWYYSGLISFKSQFDEGVQSITDSTRISDFMAPAYLNMSIGMDFKYKDNLTVFISPLSGKITFVLDTALSAAGAFGIEPGKSVRNEFGGYIKIQYKANIAKNIAYTTKLDLFSNYLEKPQNVDVNWENLISMKINNFFSASLMFHLIYDDDTKIAYDSNGDGIADSKRARLQVKELLGIGLTYKF